MTPFSDNDSAHVIDFLSEKWSILDLLLRAYFNVLGYGSYFMGPDKIFLAPASIYYDYCDD